MEHEPDIYVDPARRGDRDAFRMLVEAHSHSVFRIAFRVLGDEASAEDAVQETFLRAYQSLSSFDGRARFSTWLHRIAVNQAIDLQRRLKRRKTTALADDPALDLADPTSEEPRPFVRVPRGQRHDDLRRTLDLMDEPAVPERKADYGAQVWRRLEGRLPQESASILSFQRPNFRRPETLRGVPRWMALAAAAVLLLGLGFLLGRLGSPATMGPDTDRLAQGTDIELDSALDPALSDRGRQRLLTAALTSHFGRSERLLAEISNAQGEGLPDPVLEQAWASELLTANRLYRRAAEEAGQKRIARLLAELEPVLLELAHAGTEPSSEEWNQLKRRIDERGLLFKVRVTEDRLDSNHPDTTHPTPHRETI